MKEPLRLGLAGLALAASIAWPAAAEDAGLVARALAAAGAGDWAGALAQARQSGPVAVDLVAWQRLRAGQGAWAEYRDFAARRGHWPGMDLIYQRGDAVLTADLPATDVLSWFGDRRPTGWLAERALLAALQATDPARASAEAVRFWTETPLGAGEQAAMLAALGDVLAPHHEARLARMLDLGEWKAAVLMVEPGAAPAPLRPTARPDPASPAAGTPAAGVSAATTTATAGAAAPEPARALVTGAAADLARARIALQSGQGDADRLARALPAALRDDAGLAMDRFDRLRRDKRPDTARDLLLTRSTSAAALRDPARWASFRVDHARAALRAGDWALAERLARDHFLPVGQDDYADLEWLAGYAALRAGAADRALAHFRHLETVVASPISASRALYWQGRALEAAGDAAAAQAAFARAARHQSAYYGQLAAERVGAPMDPALAVAGPAIDSLPDWRGTELTRNDVWQAAVWLIAAGDAQAGQRFLLHLAETAAPDDIARMARLMLELHRPWDALRLAKQAAGKGAVYPAAYFPLTGLERRELGLPPELVLSIARRESEFNHTVSSRAGAKGLMQVMPDTARMMAARLGEPYQLDRLTRDAAYNARLGAAYLQGLRDRFGASIALVAAGYNAGPGRSARWLRDFGDLRRTGRRGADPVDWVEMIPFDETRNYVMRVTESLPVYRARIAGRPVPIVPSWDLRGGGEIPPPALSPMRLAESSRPPAKPIRGAGRASTAGAGDAAGDSAGDAADRARLSFGAGTVGPLDDALRQQAPAMAADPAAPSPDG